jgi:hypothetical protein
MVPVQQTTASGSDESRNFRNAILADEDVMWHPLERSPQAETDRAYKAFLTEIFIMDRPEQELAGPSYHSAWLFTMCNRGGRL